MYTKNDLQKFSSRKNMHIDAAEGMCLAVSHLVTPAHFYMQVQVHV